ncbi:DUF4124 domain-containing protein [Marilutibacter maris]
MGLLVIAMPAAAQQVHKCVSQDGSVSYQSAPCASTAKQEKSWDAKPEPPPTNAERWRRYYEARRGEADSQYLSRLAGTSRTPSRAQGAAISSSSGSNARCEQTKRSRDAAYERYGLNRTFEQSSYWDGRVRDACK